MYFFKSSSLIGADLLDLLFILSFAPSIEFCNINSAICASLTGSGLSVTIKIKSKRDKSEGGRLIFCVGVL